MSIASDFTATAFVLFRLPHSQHFTKLTQYHTPRAFSSLSEVPLTGGYLIHPFCVESDFPIVWIEPDIVSQEEVSIPHSLHKYSQGNDDEREVRQQYVHSFRALHTMLCNGALQKVVLARPLHITNIRIDDVQHLFFRACLNRPGSYIALWHTPQTGTWLVATPEPLLEYVHHRWHTVALAGTLPYSESTPALWNDKNREEQAIVARFVHQKLSTIASEVTHSEVYTLPSGNIQHLCTDFSFPLSSAQQALSIMQCLHPTPAVCGLPREEALQAILRHEPSPRQYYAGFSGPFLLQGATHLYVSLRCMHLFSTSATLYAGGGLMPESQEQDEWDETVRKMLTMKQLF